ncbi:homocysteine S-methyltransferase family protein [Micromonospora sp. NPDC003776]
MEHDATVLDGGVATELQRAGRSMRAPWWSADVLLDEAGRALLRRVHEEYAAAGADVLTAATFRCTRRAAREAGADPATAARLIGVALRIVREAAGDRPVRVAASLAPVEDCYRPDLVPDDATLADEHGWMADRFRAEAVDLVLVETMNTVREASCATAAVTRRGLPAWTSFVCRPDGRLLSGEDIGDAAQAAEAAGAGAVLVNCTTPAASKRALRRARLRYAGPLGAYPNLEDRRGISPAASVDRYLPAGVDGAQFADWARRGRDELGLTIVGGCCGSTPGHIAVLRRALSADGG